MYLCVCVGVCQCMCDDMCVGLWVSVRGDSGSNYPHMWASYPLVTASRKWAISQEPVFQFFFFKNFRYQKMKYSLKYKTYDKVMKWIFFKIILRFRELLISIFWQGSDSSIQYILNFQKLQNEVQYLRHFPFLKNFNTSFSISGVLPQKICREIFQIDVSYKVQNEPLSSTTQLLLPYDSAVSLK